MKKPPANDPLPPPPPPITAAMREQWREWMLSMSPYPPEEWVDKIKAGKPRRITTNTSGEYLAVCDLDRQGVFVINMVENPKGATNGVAVFSVTYPAPKQADLL